MNSKIITFSFDDGIEDDFKLVEILNKYNLKATFNLNSAKLTGASTWVYNNVKTVKQINYFQIKNKPYHRRTYDTTIFGYYLSASLTLAALPTLSRR